MKDHMNWNGSNHGELNGYKQFFVTAMFGLLSEANIHVMDEAFQFAPCNHHFVASVGWQRNAILIPVGLMPLFWTRQGFFGPLIWLCRSFQTGHVSIDTLKLDKPTIETQTKESPCLDIIYQSKADFCVCALIYGADVRVTPHSGQWLQNSIPHNILKLSNWYSWKSICFLLHILCFGC